MLNVTCSVMREMVVEQVRKCRERGEKLYPGTLPRITQEHEAAFRLCHQDFFGLSVDDAARILHVSREGIHYMLKCVKKVAPQLFPVLPRRSARVHFLFTVENLTPIEIARHMSISEKTVRNMLWKMYETREETGLYFRAGSKRRIAYRPWMDPYVRQEF